MNFEDRGQWVRSSLSSGILRDKFAIESIAMSPRPLKVSRKKAIPSAGGQSAGSGRKTLNFTVDSALLKELGERLVGKAHIAIAELIKNAYDADANDCNVDFHDDEIVISDNGHGMSRDEFEKFWMRVGTTHKSEEGRSRRLKRPLTGSKGVGRLAVQFLAAKTVITTRSKGAPALVATVEWEKAVAAGELTKAQAVLTPGSEETFAGDSEFGTKIVLSRLRHHWDEAAIEGVAREIWPLVPPYEDKENLDPNRFKVRLRAGERRLVDAFKDQLVVLKEQWIAKISGEITRSGKSGSATVSVIFAGDAEKYRETFHIADCKIQSASWEIRVFNLSGRLRGKISVQDARDYLAEFGGVAVYDGAFRLPYYGATQDWLDIEVDHSHRKVRSDLLPEKFHVARGLNDLPTQSRLLGAVRINTGLERKWRSTASADGVLTIQVTRDRLVANTAYRQLRDAVRQSLDYYATRSMLRRNRQTLVAPPKESSGARLKRVRHILEGFRGSISKKEWAVLESAVDEVVDSQEQETAHQESLQRLLGPLASAGLAALALEHENNRELVRLEALAGRVATDNSFDRKAAAAELKSWIASVRGTWRIFSTLTSPDDRSSLRQYKAAKVLERVVQSLDFFLTGIDIYIGVPPSALLPDATMAEWQGLFQNILINAANAMADTRAAKAISIEYGEQDRRCWLLLSDTGKGIDWRRSSELFDPFQRDMELTSEQRAVGFGGLGLGLTIVRAISTKCGCVASFVEPASGYSTTFKLAWEVKESQ